MERRIVECEELGIDSNDVQSELSLDTITYYKRNVEFYIEDLTNVIDASSEMQKRVNPKGYRTLKQKRAFYVLFHKELKDRIKEIRQIEVEELRRRKYENNNLFAQVCQGSMTEEMRTDVWNEVERRKESKNKHYDNSI